MTHDYKRNGITDLFAALNVGAGEVLWSCRVKHTSTDVLAFFKLIDANVARDLDIHVVLDNLSAHMAPPVTDWLAHPKRTRWHLHFTPTTSRWCNLVERWFKELTDRRLRRGTFTNVGNLIDGIYDWAEHWNSDPQPYVWHKTAEEIITKVHRGRTTLARSQIRDAALGSSRWDMVDSGAGWPSRVAAWDHKFRGDRGVQGGIGGPCRPPKVT